MKTLLLLACWIFTLLSGYAGELARNFSAPPDSARPWVFWFWINGNISKEGITADLEAMKRVGIGGVLWMEVSGPWWAPEGKVAAGTPQWQDCMQWAVSECHRLGLEFDLSVDFGYGSGGPHITPELSMQKLYWSETNLAGGQKVTLVLPRPSVQKNISAWLRPGAQVSETVRKQVEEIDSYRDVAVLAVPAPGKGRPGYRIPDLQLKDGTDWRLPRREAAAPPSAAVIAKERVIDLTDRMGPDGRLTWEVPAGDWLILRFGHASNYKMTRPCPASAVGLECDRLATAGINAHYQGFLKEIFQGAGPAAGKALTHVHIDSWEAGGQNWTAGFPAEFRQRRGYDLRPWLPVLSGRVVGSADLSERFLWDVRMTVSEMIRDNYARRLRELAQRHNIKLSIEAYGHLCIDNLSYAGVCDLPISEFWAKGDGMFPIPGSYENSTKAMASAAHTYGKPVIGAESFTSDRGWRDHPFLLKGMGDRKFCQGLNRMIFHLSAHQAYDEMIPGLTHRKWGEHIQRHNTWFEFSPAWLQYLARCQYLLQQGEFVADVCYWPGEGVPLNVNDMRLDLPSGYDFDFCSSEMVQQLSVKDGMLVLPSGMKYRFLQLPDTDRMTLPMARKVRELSDAGARIIGGKPLQGAPGLTGFPAADEEVRKISESLRSPGRVTTDKTFVEIFAKAGLPPDFEGEGLEYIHRRIDGLDVYFVSNPQNRSLETTCQFRVTGRVPELWDPETGAIRPLPEYSEADGRVSVPLRFEPMQSWFIVWQASRAATPNPTAGKNFVSLEDTLTLAGPWEVSFDPKWGGPEKPVTFDTLESWNQNVTPGIRYYSGTATYRKQFQISPALAQSKRILLDLGSVEVMARVSLNGQDCGIAWKPPYHLDISKALQPGENKLEIAVVNLWINRLIGDEQLPLDGKWKDFETLLEWPEWFVNHTARESGRYTFTSCRPYTKDTPLSPSGLLGPVKIKVSPNL